MKDNDIRQRLQEAVLRTAPSDVQDVLSRCEARKGNIIYMKAKKKRNWVRGVIAACLALVIVGAGGGLIYGNNYAVASVVSLDVNPSIELKVNRNQTVIVCEGLNEEGKQVLGDMTGGADLKGTKLSVAVNAVVGSLVRNGYLDSISSAILISVEDKDETRAARLQQQLTQTVDVVLAEQSANAAVLSQTVAKDAATEKQAEQYSISTGKAALVNRVLSINASLKFEELAALSVEELKDMIETGAPGMPIGRQQAAELAKQHAGIAEADIRYEEVDAELDDTPPHYDVELYTAQSGYEYKVNAYTGEVIDRKDKAVAQTGTAPQQSSDTAAANTIGEDEAFAIAWDDFGKRYPEGASAGVTAKKVTMGKDDGRLNYDVEFMAGDYRADYEVDASDGSIRERDIDYKKPAASQSTQGSTGADAGAAKVDIGKEKAMAIALAHAGLGEGQVTGLKAEKDKDDGRVEYEVEFRSGGMEYDYTIDAATGAVLEHEKDIDD